ncbi:MAG: hypothetical protein WBC93_03965 [Sulfitobacter sp.]
MKKLVFLMMTLSSAALAQDFSTGSTAKSWNLYGEIPATFEARVVDVLCELTGDCPDDCGAGTRQIGLVRTADGVLVLAMKNSQAAFTGAAADLAPYCNQTVRVDGLLLEDEDVGAKNVYLVQKIKSEGEDWVKANQFTKIWARNHPEAKGKGPWFRRDPRIKEIIGREGYLGLGLDEDAKYAEENF